MNMKLLSVVHVSFFGNDPACKRKLEDDTPEAKLSVLELQSCPKVLFRGRLNLTVPLTYVCSRIRRYSA